MRTFPKKKGTEGKSRKGDNETTRKKKYGPPRKEEAASQKGEESIDQDPHFR